MESTSQGKNVTFSILSSSILHAGLVVGVLAMNLAMPEMPQRELIQFEIQDSGAALTQTATLEQPETKLAETPIANEPVIPVQKITSSAAPVIKTLPQKAKAASAPKVSSVVTPVPVVVNSTPSVDDDSEASSLPTEAVAMAAPELEDSAVDEDLDRADQEASQAVQAKAASLKEVDDVIDDSEVLAAKAQQEQLEKAAVLAKASAARRAQEKTALENARQAQVKAMAAEQGRMKAENDKHAQAQAAARAQEASAAEEKFRAARAAAIAAAAETSAKREQDADAALAEGDAATQEAQSGAAKATAAALAAEKARQAQAQSDAAAAATTQKIRALEELRQMPGNRLPFYAEDDRLAGRQGAVIFYAFITKDGAPGEIKLMQSSGHKNLDLKTLKAIREWRFYPGQEGWVEIPFRWDLKGEPQLVRGTLRKVSQK